MTMTTGAGVAIDHVLREQLERVARDFSARIQTIVLTRMRERLEVMLGVLPPPPPEASVPEVPARSTPPTSPIALPRDRMRLSASIMTLLRHRREGYSRNEIARRLGADPREVFDELCKLRQKRILVKVGERAQSRWKVSRPPRT